MKKDSKYSDDELIAILVCHHREVTNCEPNNAELTKIKNTIIFNANDDKAMQLQPLRSYFYQQHSRWPTTIEYENMLRYYYDKTT